MLKAMTFMLCVAALSGCATSDWMADPDDPNYVPYEAQYTYDAQADTDAVISHERAVNAQNCVDAAAGHDLPCYD